MTVAHGTSDAGPLRERVDVWAADTREDDPSLSSLEATLSLDEHIRASGFRRACDRRAFVARRGLLRQLLAYYGGVGPAELCIGPDPCGKPIVSHPYPATAISFNVSHSAGMTLFAFTTGREVGIDLEAIRHVPDRLEIAALVLDLADVRAVGAAADPDRALLIRWVRNEALVKAVGLGLGRGRAVRATIPRGHLTVADLNVGGAYVAALADWSPRIQLGDDGAELGEVDNPKLRFLAPLDAAAEHLDRRDAESVPCRDFRLRRITEYYHL